MEEVRADILKFTQGLDHASEPTQRRTQILVEIGQLGDSGQSSLRKFLLIMEFLLQELESNTKSSQEAPQLLAVADALLKLKGIGPDNSRLSFLYNELTIVQGRFLRRQGDRFLGSWAILGVKVNPDRDPVGSAWRNIIVQIQTAQRMGQTQVVLDLVLQAHGLATSLEHVQELKHLQLTAQRLSNTLSGASELTSEWHEMCLLAQTAQDLGPMISAAGRKDSRKDPVQLLEARLWTFAIPTRSWLGRLSSAKSIRAQFGGRLERGSPMSVLWETVAALEDFYDDEIPLPLRVKKLGSHLALAAQLPSIEQELLVWAAAGRALYRARQLLVAGSCFTEYRALSLRLSSGASSDVLGLTTDVLERSWVAADTSPTLSREKGESLDTIPTSGITRAMTLGRVGIGIASASLRMRLRGIGTGTKSGSSMSEREAVELGKMLLDNIGRMKGPVVKLAQVLGFVSPELPTSIRDHLMALQDRTAPMSGHIIRNLVEQSLGHAIPHLFDEWNDQPIAAASIGQVHRAITKDGREVAVKVQFPRIRDAIRSDMRLIRMLVPFLRTSYPNVHLKSICDAAEATFLRECDYRQEAQFQQGYADRFQGHAEIYIPSVYPALSGEGVITMDYVHGQRFQQFALHANQKEKNRAGGIIMKFSMRSAFLDGVINGDPGPGNIIFMDDGRVAFLDFGVCEHLDKQRTQKWNRLMHGLMTLNRDEYQQSFMALGYIADEAKFDFDTEWKISLNITKFLRQTHRFTQPWHKAAINEVIGANPNRPLYRLPLPDLRFQRNFMILGRTLAELQAECNWREIIEPILSASTEEEIATAG